MGKSCREIFWENLVENLVGNLVGNVAGNVAGQVGGEKVNLRKAVIGKHLAFGIG